VEDTINLLGHAPGKVVGMLARQQGSGPAEGITVLAAQAAVPELAASSLKAALDLDWDDPASLQQALGVMLVAVGRVEGLAAELGGSQDPAVARGLAAARQIQSQDTVVGVDGVRQIRQGVARDGGSRSRIPSWATAARPAASGSTATSATCSVIWTPSWSQRSR
jgi:hypothetical protein